MLSTFLTQIQNYFSKYFLVGSFFPVLAFAFLNGLIAYPLIGAWRGWANTNILQMTAAGAAFFTASIVVALALAAYVLASLGTFLRRVLEGQWPGRLRAVFVPAQYARRETLFALQGNAGQEMADLAFSSEWMASVGKAWIDGSRDHPGLAWIQPNPDRIGAELARLDQKRLKYEVIPALDLQNAANLLAAALRTCDMNSSPALDAYQRRLQALIQYATDRARGRRAQLQNELNSNFGEQDIAPTKMGNVANTIQGYVMRRYHCNFETVWSNLQRIVPKDDKAEAALQEAKTQLDFLVACCWLSLLSALLWSLYFAFADPNRWGFLAAALGGPVFAYMWYRAAAEQYRSFADVAMTSFDTFRFDLLGQIGVNQPANVEEERLIWENFDRLATFGELQNFQYDPPKPK
jgi:hypothetical protein